MTFIGLLAAALGGIVIGAGFYLPLVFLCSRQALRDAPTQWPILIVGGLCAVIGSLIDSLIGATLQYSGKVSS